MKKFLTIFFVSLGVIFFLILLALAYFFIADPYNIKPFIFGNDSSQVQVINNQQQNITDDATATVSSDENKESNSSTDVPTQESNLSPAQAKALDTIGVNPDVVPQSFTPAQLKCFEAILGIDRVNEIKNGDTPSLKEFYDAKACV